MKDEGLTEPVTRIDSDKWTCPPGDQPPAALETGFHGEQATKCGRSGPGAELVGK